MSAKNIRECLMILKQDMPVSPQIEKMADNALGALDALEKAHAERCELAEAIAEGDKDALERLAQMACDERNAALKEEA